jgi:CRISPR-associated endonuclease/helicase Cas3
MVVIGGERLSCEMIAHVRKNEDGTWAEPQCLIEHLEGTAKLARCNANKFASGEWGQVLGLNHDTGKGRTVWQDYLVDKSGYGYDEDAHLEGKPGKVLHAIYGAKLAEEVFGKGIGRVLAYCIAGHHAGLPDWSGAEGSGKASLKFQEEQANGWEEINSSLVEILRSLPSLKQPWKLTSRLDFSLWVRMLFSCLVDADFLDTEKYMDQNKNEQRGNYCKIGELLKRFNQYIACLEQGAKGTNANRIRMNIRKKCVQMAGEAQGIYSLSVPTGGGKTLSTLAFALEHAKKHHLDRIIYVIPYTSIIEQNADVFRKAVGVDQVVEHHSSLNFEEISPQARLAAENWDAPVIVTTSVQFFESLFAAKPSRCRKLHNIARSVVILDEAQLLPTEFLEPILETMQLLTEHYHVTFVISTATQPAFAERKGFMGLKNIREIMGTDDEVKNLYASLKRNKVIFPADVKTPSNWEEIASELSKHDQVLCIVSDRKSCRELHRMMPRGTFHLSGMMCGQHRSHVIEEIKSKLKNMEPVRVISTQLVEAGVDFDFPVVYRAFAGLDSIIQAAGRCNREGNLEIGKVVVFVPPRKAPIGILRKAAESAAGMVASGTDPLAYGVFEHYFSELYWKAKPLDKYDICRLLDLRANDPYECSIYFRTAAERFKIIDDSQIKTIFVRYDQGNDLINRLIAQGPDRRLLRQLQRYTVNIYNQTFYEMLNRGALEAVFPGVYALTSDSDYSNTIGLKIDVEFEPDDYIQ